MGSSLPPMSGAPLPVGTSGDVTLDIDEAERYERGLLLGRGGMGEVALCWDRRLEREVAYKTLQPARSERRFVDEARITAALEHPAIIRRPVLADGRKLHLGFSADTYSGIFG